MKRCKHQWEWLIPAASETNDSVGLIIATLGDSLIKRSVICTECGKVGYKINSHRGGIRFTGSDYLLEKAKKLSEQFGFNLPNKLKAI